MENNTGPPGMNGTDGEPGLKGFKGDQGLAGKTPRAIASQFRGYVGL